jgi:non-ribosomal peptide synthetase component F
MLLQAIYKVLLHRYTGQNDICVGSSVARRDQAELAGLIGFFVNTIAVRNEITNDITFESFLAEVRKATMEAYAHQDVPFEKVVEVSVKERDLSRNPLFQVMIVMINTPEVPVLKLDKLEISLEDPELESVKFEITYFFRETAGGLKGFVQYRTDLFTEDTIKRMTGHFMALMRAIPDNPSQKVGMIQMHTEAEQKQILADFIDFDLD